MTDADSVFLLAARARVQPSIVNPMDYEQNNTIGVLNVLKCATEARVRRVVYSASSSAYGDSKVIPLKETLPVNPLSPYGAQKYYGDAAFWWIISCSNPGLKQNSYFIPIGIQIRIPQNIAEILSEFRILNDR